MSTSQAQYITGCMFVHMAWLAESLSTKGEVRGIVPLVRASTVQTRGLEFKSPTEKAGMYDCKCLNQP